MVADQWLLRVKCYIRLHEWLAGERGGVVRVREGESGSSSWGGEAQVTSNTIIKSLV